MQRRKTRIFSMVYWRRRSRQRNCEAIYSRVDRVNSGGIPCATGCKATSGAVTTKSLRSRRTEGLSDKNSLYGKFGKNVVYGRVRSSKFAFSPWYTVGRAACLPPLAPNVRLRISHRKNVANGKHHTVLKKSGAFQR